MAKRKKRKQRRIRKVPTNQQASTPPEDEGELSPYVSDQIERDLLDKLTAKQRAFVVAYMGEARGNGTEAARLAGYAGDGNVLAVTSHANLRNPKILSAIGQIERNDPLVASRVERQRWWTKIMLDPTTPVKERLRASELLGKSGADFVARTELTGRNGGPIKSAAVTYTKEDLDNLTPAQKAALWKDSVGEDDE